MAARKSTIAPRSSCNPSLPLPSWAMVCQVTSELAKAAAFVESAGEGVVAGVFAGLADGEATCRFLSRDLFGRVCRACLGQAEFGRWIGRDCQWSERVGKVPGVAAGAIPICRGKVEVGGDGGAEGAAAGAVTAGMAVAARAAVEGIEEARCSGRRARHISASLTARRQSRSRR